jgi:hypothetical protein
LFGVQESLICLCRMFLGIKPGHERLGFAVDCGSISSRSRRNSYYYYYYYYYYYSQLLQLGSEARTKVVAGEILEEAKTLKTSSINTL